MNEMRVEEIRCKTILNQCTMPFADYTLNAYQGCAFGCSYCYVPAMRRRRGQEDDRPWGAWVQVKVNAEEVLRVQMRRVAPEARIAIGTATDSWQPIEKRYSIARGILRELARYPNPVHIVTRGPLLLRDIDILSRMPNVGVGVSVPAFDDRTRRIFEPRAPAMAGRLHLVRKLIEARVPVTLFWCPILYNVSDNADAVRDYLRQATELGVQRVVADTLGYMDALARSHAKLVARYRMEIGQTQPALPRPALAAEIAHWANRYGVDCRLPVRRLDLSESDRPKTVTARGSDQLVLPLPA